jgi:hypothetical protein
VTAVRGPWLVVCWVAYFAVGVLLGLVGAFFTPTVPLGVLLGCLGVPALAAAGIAVSGRLAVGIAAYVGWLAVVVVLCIPRHTDVAVIMGTVAGNAFVYGGALLGGAVLVMAPILAMRRQGPAPG